MAATLTLASRIDNHVLVQYKLNVVNFLYGLVQEAIGKRNAIYRDLRPNDINPATAPAITGRLSNPTLTGTTLATGVYGGPSLLINQAFAFIGYEQLSPSPLIDEIQIGLGPQLYLISPLNPIYGSQQDNTGYWGTPAAFKPLEKVNINLLANSSVTSATEFFGLPGFVVEPYGLNVSPDAFDFGLDGGAMLVRS